MRILPVNNGHNNVPNYKSSYRSYITRSVKGFGDFDKQVVWTTTNFFRDDFDWKCFIKYLLFHFNGKDRVNAYSLACSDGSEAYTYAISLMEEIPYSAHTKFFPVFASDIDSEVINCAKSGKINIEDSEFYYINKMGMDLNYYFENKNKPIKIERDSNCDKTVGLYSYEPISELKQAVEFKQSDILSELKNINDSGNSVVMCRNVMPYLNDNYVEKVIKAASDVLKDGSLFVIGDYDSCKNIDEQLLKNGFYRPLIENRNVYQKGNSKELTDRLLSGYLI